MFTKFIITLLLPLFFIAGWFINSYTSKNVFIQTETIENTPVEPERPFLKYTIENLSATNLKPGIFSEISELKKEDNFTSHKFIYNFSPGLDNSTKNVSGQLNIPNGTQKYPLILMLRGFVNQQIYTTGMGTKNASEYFSNNGFITLAPDYLGYADSDKESDNIFETRFQTYTTVLSLIEVLPAIDQWDGKNVMIWAHSNGGQVALTILVITGNDYPTTLWAPVTKPFPFSVLYFTDEANDKGKFIRSELAELEALYDVEQFSFDNYLDKLNAPLMLHQGSADDAVPLTWSNSIANKLRKIDKEIIYHTYPGSDHNLRPAWDNVIARDLEFFSARLK